MFNNSDLYNSKLAKINKLFLNTSDTTSSTFYSTNRQLGSATNSSSQYNYSTGLDNKSTSLFLKYNFNLQASGSTRGFYNQFMPENNSTALKSNAIINTTNNSVVGLEHGPAITSFLNKPELLSTINSTSDGKSFSNPMKYILNFSPKKPAASLSLGVGNDLSAINVSTTPAAGSSNDTFTNKFKDLKSPNLSFLSSEKNTRLLDKVNPSKTNFNLSQYSNNLNSVVANTILSNQSSNESSLYDNSSKE
jgi:hypothetical protein